MLELLEQNADIVAAVGTTALATIALYVAIIPKTLRTRLAAVVILLIVGVPTTYSAWHIYQSSSTERKQILDAITGGDNFVYLEANLAAVQGTTDNIPLLLANDGPGSVFDVHIWVSPASSGAHSNQPNYGSIKNKPQPPIPSVKQGRFATSWAVPPGHYLVEIDARNGNFMESLRIVSYKGKLFQIIDVYNRKTKALIYKSPRPDWF